MAKRRRLTPAQSDYLGSAGAPETKAWGAPAYTLTLAVCYFSPHGSQVYNLEHMHLVGPQRGVGDLGTLPLLMCHPV